MKLCRRFILMMIMWKKSPLIKYVAHLRERKREKKRKHTVLHDVFFFLKTKTTETDDGAEWRTI